MVVAAMPILYDGRSAGRRGRARPVDLGPPIAAVAGDGAPSRQIGAVERHGGGGNALALLEAGEHVARGARHAAPAQAGEPALAADTIGHGHEGDILERPRRREALGRLAAPAPHAPLVLVGDPVGTVVDEVRP